MGFFSILSGGQGAASPSASSTCNVVLYPNVDATSGGLVFQALSNQILAGRAVSTEEVDADVISAATDYYRAELVRGATYRVAGDGTFAFADKTFTVPDSPTADLKNLLSAVREVS